MSKNPDLTLIRKDGKSVLNLAQDEKILELIEETLNPNEFEEDMPQNNTPEQAMKHRFFKTQETASTDVKAALELDSILDT